MNGVEITKGTKPTPVSELLRLAAGENMIGGWASTVCKLAHLLGFDEETIANFGGGHLLPSAIRKLADKIDGEVQGAYERGLTAAKENDFVVFDHEKYGWPAPRSDENLKAYIERCFLPRPRYEDGDPAQFGDEMELRYKSGGCDKGRFQEIKYNKGPVWILSFTGVDHALEYRYDSDSDTIKRHAPEVLGADGLPIKVGETVYLANDGIEGTVKELLVDEKAYIEWCDETFTPGVLCKNLTHTPPDTLGRLRDDITEWRAECAKPGSGWDAKTAEWADRIDAIIRRKGGAE